MNKILFFLLFINSVVNSQNQWESITNYDLKFNMPIGYKFNETSKAKTYTYIDDNRIIGVYIFKKDITNEMKDVKLESNHSLLQYYNSVIEGYANQSGYEILTSETYNIEGNLVGKNLLKITYPNGNENLSETHIVFINGLNFFAYYHYTKNAEKEIIEDKDSFFDSFYL